MDAALPPIRLPDVLRDGDLLLDGYRLDDAEVHWQGEDDEMRRRFDSRRPATLDETRSVMQRWMDARANGGPVVYAIRQAPHGLIGGCELRLISAERANISYWLYPQHRGRGFAFRAVSLLCGAASAVNGLVQLEAHIEPDNAASRRLAERLGFVEVGTVDDTAWDGVVGTRLLYTRPA